jgi:hypothetical protein
VLPCGGRSGAAWGGGCGQFAGPAVAPQAGAAALVVSDCFGAGNHEQATVAQAQAGLVELWQLVVCRHGVPTCVVEA